MKRLRHFGRRALDQAPRCGDRAHDRHVTMIHRAERLGEILAGLGGRAGEITILPVCARQGRPAGRVIVLARKGAKAPPRLLFPFIMHEKPSHLTDGEDLSAEAREVLRQGVALNLRDR